MPKKEPERTFESALGRLDEILAQLDAGESTLDASLQLFSEGAELLRYCNETLNNAELKMEEILPKEAQI